jgi:hypothetical protein
VGFTCSVCGEYHDETLRDVRAGLPEPVFALGEAEREERVEVGDDWCRFLDSSGEMRHYMRGLLHLPVREDTGDFRFGVWVEVSAEDFQCLWELWSDVRGHESAPFFGRLANELTSYGGTVGLPVALQLREVSVLPAVVVLTSDHPLGHDQRAGITAGAAQRLAEAVLH